MRSLADITEKDVELALIDEIRKDKGNRTFLDNQVDLSIGILDVLYWDINKLKLVVVEVKKNQATCDDIIQLLGYTSQVETIFYSSVASMFNSEISLDVNSIICAPGIRNGFATRLWKVGWLFDFMKWSYRDNKFSFDIQYDSLDYDCDPKSKLAKAIYRITPGAIAGMLKHKIAEEQLQIRKLVVFGEHQMNGGTASPHIAPDDNIELGELSQRVVRSYGLDVVYGNNTPITFIEKAPTIEGNGDIHWHYK